MQHSHRHIELVHIARPAVRHLDLGQAPATVVDVPRVEAGLLAVLLDRRRRPIGNPPPGAEAVSGPCMCQSAGQASII
jgi:hypothetical protein